MYSSLKDLLAAKMYAYSNKVNLYNRVTKSPCKGRAYRVQQIFDKNGFVVKQIIHHV